MTTLLTQTDGSKPGPFRRLYGGPPELRDEMVDAEGGLRPHWQTFVSALDELGVPEVTRRWDEARQLIREHGVTYNVYGDPRGLGRPWVLDPIPLLISAADSDALEAGLVQRARLLELVLADLYGAQTLLHSGLLPPELVFDHPGFLRSCHVVHPSGGRFLHLYAANLGRTPDGRVWILGDRTQAPSGAGYVLENRLVLSRMLPDVFRDCQVQRLARFFLTVRETLREIAPHHRDNPRVVLLTPGPYNETYFEHAFLAKYLGYTLVEGGDLTVRGDRVFLKLLGGLQPVDVILRRLDDDFCDPLQLKRDSFLGAPGLVQAVRAGNVAVANPLGSGLVETPALMAFLPTLCQRLLGEPLKLPSVPSWWCGDATAREHVLANLRRLVIKPSFPSSGVEPIFGAKLSHEQLRTVTDRIRARPRDFVGQEQLELSTAPVLADGHLLPRRFVFRAFLAAAGDSFVVMPGGLTRTAAGPDSLVVSMQQGGGSKDTWVLSAGPVSSFSLLPPFGGPLALSRGGGDLPSRAADNLHWLGRYVERAEGCVRLLRGILVRLTEKSGLAEVPELPALLRALTHQTMTYPGFAGPGAEARLAGPDHELLSIAYNGSRPGSLQWTLDSLQRVSRTVRDRISSDTWRVLNRLKLAGRPRLPDATSEMTARTAIFNQDTDLADEPGETAGTLSDLLESIEDLVISLTAFSGLAMESMTRGQGWRFLELGRQLERAAHTINLLKSTLTKVSGGEGPLLEALLEIAESSMTYRRRYLSSVQAAPVLDLLLADETNPRSLAFQLVAVADHVEHLSHDDAHPQAPNERQVALAALTDLRQADINALARATDEGLRPELAELLTRLGKQIPLLSDKITQNYLTHVQASQQLAALKNGGLP
jgi:uncharacterized circularly permuted ATP-grasp superfamily protein/uncharacterized alpha-E superfamily protein